MKKIWRFSGATSHTLGPWKVVSYFNEACIIGNAKLNRGFYTVCTVDGNPIETKTNNFFNAHLIAAAPDMLAALELISADYMDRYLTTSQKEAVLNALKKAKGEL